MRKFEQTVGQDWLLVLTGAVSRRQQQAALQLQLGITSAGKWWTRPAEGLTVGAQQVLIGLTRFKSEKRCSCWFTGRFRTVLTPSELSFLFPLRNVTYRPNQSSDSYRDSNPPVEPPDWVWTLRTGSSSFPLRSSASPWPTCSHRTRISARTGPTGSETFESVK